MRVPSTPVHTLELAASLQAQGICYDYSMAETFFKSIKAELIFRDRWDTRRQAEGAIFQLINGFSVAHASNLQTGSIPTFAAQVANGCCRTKTSGHNIGSKNGGFCL